MEELTDEEKAKELLRPLINDISKPMIKAFGGVMPPAEEIEKAGKAVSVLRSIMVVAEYLSEIEEDKK